MKKGMIRLFGILCLVSFGVSMTANAKLKAKEKKQLTDWNNSAKNPSEYSVKTFKDKCGFDVKFSLNEDLVVPFMKENASAIAYCDTPRYVMSSMCADDTYKAAIKENIKSIQCKVAKKGEMKMTLNKGTFVLQVGPGAANIDAGVKKYLEDNL